MVQRSVLTKLRLVVCCKNTGSHSYSPQVFWFSCINSWLLQPLVQVNIQNLVDIVNWYRMVFNSSRSIRENHVCPWKNGPKAPPSSTKIQHIMKCDLVAEAFCPFWPLPNAACSRLKQTCQIWFLRGSPNLSMIYKWRQRSFLDDNFHNLPLNCCTWFLIWWEFLNCPFLATLTSPDCLDWPWYTPKPPSKKGARSQVLCEGALKPHLPGVIYFPWRKVMPFQAWPISKNAPRGQHFARVVIVFWAGFETLRVPSDACFFRGRRLRCLAGVVMKFHDC